MDKATATDIGLPTFEPRVAGGGYGGVVKMDPTDLPQYTAAEDVWVKGDAVAAELAALRAERDDLRAENELLQEQVMATQRDDDGIDALRARIAELEAAGRAVIGCNDQVCAFAPNRCEAQCRADEMLHAALRASASAGAVHD